MANTPSLQSLLNRDSFVHRHIGPSPEQIEAMLSALGVDSLKALIDQTVPANIQRSETMPLAPPCDESNALSKLKTLAQQNKVFTSCIGMGYYDTIVPPVILRNVLENPGWYTAYTPYQPEIAQGRLEGLLNFQQMILDLTGMELANASLLDEATAAAEAMALCKRVVKKNKSNTFFIADDCHPQTIAVVQTRAKHFNMDIVIGNPSKELNQQDYFGVLLQYPGTYGNVNDITPIIEQAHSDNALVVVATDLLSLTLMTPPGELGADVVVGSSQRFGVPMGYGGPHAAFFATREKFKRSTPGRIIGVSVDSNGKQALRMALQTREQHIRREKANSNICTSQALLAIMAAFYAIYHGPEGLKTIGQRVHRLSAILATALQKQGFVRRNQYFFDTLTISVGDQQQTILQRSEQSSINLRKIDNDGIGISLDETTSIDDINALFKAISGKQDSLDIEQLDREAPSGIPENLLRQSSYLQHQVFNNHHSETEMLRYMKQLESKDIALNHSMIALGSCTMKLNATAEMIPITWPEFANIHPFAPIDQVSGYQQMISELEQMLIATTGYDNISMQPNAGSQGEYAGLLAIKKYHQSRGNNERDICLIPSSAHGTNPASAAMANMRVVIVRCDENGNVDINDLQEKAQRHQDELAAIMVTYPSTHGVFEESIREVCDIVHLYGGQVYVDGANMNALVGLAAPGHFGADVSHLNLHKTFAIPHGGGGPGMGPIAVKSHLAPYLPNHPVSQIGNLDKDNDVVSAAAWGSAAILTIPWMYITMMGESGLKKATEVAILNANYIAQRLNEHYPVLYTGSQGRVAHECIIDLRPLKDESGISEEDIAKRLMDYGFHAPTMSFPVPGTLMIEPTESESLNELDRFCDAMISIRQEINLVISGAYDQNDNPLKNAPHTAETLVSDNWSHAYSRDIAAFPNSSLKENKYWPPVGRIDNVYGDRNLFCACPSIESYLT